MFVDSVARTPPLGRLQLVISVGMLNRLRSVLEGRPGVPPAAVENYVAR